MTICHSNNILYDSLTYNFLIFSLAQYLRIFIMEEKLKEKLIYIMSGDFSELDKNLVAGWHIKEIHACGCRQGGRCYVWLTTEENSPA